MTRTYFHPIHESNHLSHLKAEPEHENDELIQSVYQTTSEWHNGQNTSKLQSLEKLGMVREAASTVALNLLSSRKCWHVGCGGCSFRKGNGALLPVSDS